MIRYLPGEMIEKKTSHPLFCSFRDSFLPINPNATTLRQPRRSVRRRRYLLPLLRYYEHSERMTDNDGEGTNTRKNEWEVVSLTASAYAASPGPDEVEGTQVNTEDEADISSPLFMSGHFVFPPSEHENLPLVHEDDEIPEQQKGKDDVTELGLEGSSEKDEDQTFGIVHEELPELEEGSQMQGLDLSDETSLTEESEGNSDLAADLLQLSNSIKDDDEFYEAEPPSGTWWKKRAASFYAHAKETNTLWSICIAAAVMGLVILGQRWQQERWQVLQSKWHLTIKDEKMVRVLGPIYRIKDVIVGGGLRRGSFIRGGPTGEN